jgi:molybdopterin-guanine dinucleotide biosynthesis protein B
LKVIAVVGSKSSGKTTTIEILTKELVKRGYKIAAVKHIPEKDFTIDMKGKDTWRFAQSGATKIISVAPNEVATIEKTKQENFSLKEILKKCRTYDLVFLEGFRKLVSKNGKIYKIINVKSAEEAREALKIFKPIIAFTGPYSTENLDLKIPYIDLFSNVEKLVEVIKKIVKK